MDNTLVIYTSDHGDNLGNAAFWGKSNMYEESAGVPLIMAGPEIPEGTSATPVSLVDGYPTILSCAGVKPDEEDRDLPGRNCSRWRGALLNRAW